MYETGHDPKRIQPVDWNHLTVVQASERCPGCDHLRMDHYATGTHPCAIGDCDCLAYGTNIKVADALPKERGTQKSETFYFLPGRVDTWVRVDHVVSIEYLDSTEYPTRVNLIDGRSVVTTKTPEEVLFGEPR